MMKRFLLPALTVAVLACSAKAEDPSIATSLVCQSQKSGLAKYVINGNELKKHSNMEYSWPDTFEIVLNNQYGLVAVASEAKKYPGGVFVSGDFVLINKLTGTYVETSLLTPGQPADDSGTCVAEALASGPIAGRG
jgi:hypothetical protein